MNYSELLNVLDKNSSDKLREFSQKLTPTKYPMLGVKIPVLRDIVKKLSKEVDVSFFTSNTLNTFEEVMLFGFYIGYVKADYEIKIKYLKLYIPLIDNWALTDSVVSSLKFVKNNKEKFFNDIIIPCLNGKEFDVRFSLISLLSYYITEDYLDRVFEIVDSVDAKDYYVSMAIAWLLCTAYIKFKDRTTDYFKKTNIDELTFKRTVSKIKDSFRVEKRDKETVAKLYRKV